MPDIVLQRDVGSLGALKRLSAAATAVAAGSGDSTTVTGVTIDRMNFPNGSMPNSLAAAVAWDAVLATSKTLSLGYAVQTSDDASSWTDYQTATYAAVATGSTAASAANGEFEVSVNLTSARRYVRFNFAQDLSATQTDTSAARAMGFFAGFDRIPA
jgi:methyl coenzyme M reductase beta subunit